MTRIPSTAHGIQRTGLCHVEGAHIGDASNAPEYREPETQELEPVERQVEQLREMGLI